MAEAMEIQKRMEKPRKGGKEGITRGFTRLMVEGKVKQALKLVYAGNEIAGVHTLDDRVRNLLQEKHPEDAQLHPDAVIQGETTPAQEVVFEAIDGKAIQAAARSVHGSGGPTRVDADTWKHILCSKDFGKAADELAEEVVISAQRLCVDDVAHDSINLLLDCRLVPLMKEDDGVRPIGIGEVLRRIMGKSVAKVIGSDIQLAGGTLQTCTGVEAGIEASIHAMSRIFQDEQCEAVILIDADNAFNRLNRRTSLNNIERLCPPLFRFLNNTYKEPARLHLGDGTFIRWEEGVTQGDPLAMAIYAVSTRSIIDSLKENMQCAAQVWFAEDSTAVGRLVPLHEWWLHLTKISPRYGYHPKSEKTWFIVKRPE